VDFSGLTNIEILSCTTEFGLLLYAAMSPEINIEIIPPVEGTDNIQVQKMKTKLLFLKRQRKMPILNV
jgi:hypothetical protein